MAQISIDTLHRESVLFHLKICYLDAPGLYLGLYGAQNHIEISDPFAARWDQAQFIAISDEYYQRLSNGNIEKNTLYIFSDGEKFLQLQKRNRPKEVYAYLNQTYYILFSTDSDFVWSAEQPDISFAFP